MKFNRRRFLQAFGAGAAVAATPTILRANTTGPHRVVVLGGGFAGATVAKYLRMWGGDNIAVTLVDPKASHTSCVLSNLVLNGRMRLRELKLTYDSLSSFYGVNVIRDRAVGIVDNGQGGKDGWRVELKNGADLYCDRLVVATGIGFKKPAGDFNFNDTPHAWIAGRQTTRLANKVQALNKGDTFVMTIPKSPYRCPPGPYERACLVADILKRKGGGTVTVLDANDRIQAEAPTFTRAFDELYNGIVDYRTDVSMESVDSAAGVVVTKSASGSFEEISGDVVNIIPQQRALGFVRASGLTEGEDWAAIDPLSYESTVAGFEGVHIIGDSQGSGQPKSAHMASSQAKICADAIIRMLAGVDVSYHPDRGSERWMNITTNSACYSPITYDEASWLTANFVYEAPDMEGEEVGKMALKHIGEADHWNKDNYEEMFAWASNLFTDSFH